MFGGIIAPGDLSRVHTIEVDVNAGELSRDSDNPAAGFEKCAKYLFILGPTFSAVDWAKVIILYQ